MNELTNPEFHLVAMLKRVAVLASVMVFLASCYDIHYQPVFENFPDEEYAIPYDRRLFRQKVTLAGLIIIWKRLWSRLLMLSILSKI